MIKIVLKEKPVPWTAPFTTKNFSRDPKAAIKKYLRVLVRQQYDGPILTHPVGIIFKFQFEPPKSTPKKTRALMISKDIRHTAKPDLTNLVKLAEDLLEGIIVTNDSHVDFISATKCYGEENEIVIEIYSDTYR